MRLLHIILALMLLSLPACAATSLLVDNFDSDTVGTMPTGWSKATTNASTSITVVDGTPAGNKWVRFHDENGTATTNNTLFRSFSAVTSGKVVAQFDVNLPQTMAGFGTRLCSGTPVTNGKYWCSGLVFEGKIEYAPGGDPGLLSSQTNSVPTYAVTPLNRQYSANTWYSVRVEANIDSKTYKLFFGPRGGQLTEITPTGGVTFPNTASGHTVTQINYISFFSSNRNGDDPGDLFVDNVNIYSDAETTATPGTIAAARILDRGTKVSLTDKIVTSGTANSIFYIEDDSVGAERAAGIRVRYSALAAAEGDRVDVVGRITQTNEGTVSDHTGEREIAATSVTRKSTGNTLPKPLHMKCSDVGGGWYGPMELLSSGYEPAIKGMWPANAWGNAGVTSYVPAENRGYPLNNTGILITVTGKVAEPNTCQPGIYDFHVDDGSLVNDGWFEAASYTDEVFHPRGLRVRVTDPNILTGITPLYYGDEVRVTGIVGAIQCDSLGRASTRNVRVLRPRKPEDIEVIQRQERYVKFDSQGNCIVGGHYFFPIGIFTYYWDSLTRPVILDQEFNTITTTLPDGITPAHLGQLRDDGIMVIPCMANPGTYDSWLAAKDDPQILAWYLRDEPEGSVSPAQQRADYERLRAADPSRPQGTAHFLWDALWNYRYSEDFVESDVYPIRRAPMTNVAVHMDRIHQIHGDGYPIWPFIQCYGYENPGPGNDGAAIPTRAEERCMVYLAIAHRAKAIMWFSYYPSLPDTWAEVKVLCGELRQLAPFYCMPSSEPALGNSNGNIHTRLIEIGESGLIIAVNADGGAQAANFTIPGTAPTSLTLPFEGGATVPVSAGAFSASFDGLGVHIYQWGPTPTIP